MRVLVTGAGGFAGRHVVARLAAAGHDVIGAEPDGVAPAPARGARLDVRDLHVATRLIERERPDAVLHLAAIAFVPGATRDPVRAFETNATGTLNLLLAAREAAPAARCVVVSTAEAYGRVDRDGPIPESQPIAPSTVYGASKASAEHLARALALDGQDIVILRPFNHIGPGQAPVYVVPSFAEQIARLELEGGGVLKHGNLDAVRDFLDVRDVARAYELALTAPRATLPAGEPMNVCSGSGVTIADVVRRLVARARKPIALELDPARLRKIDVPRFIGDPSRFRAATGFAPEIPLDRTLDDVLAEARRRVSG